MIPSLMGLETALRGLMAQQAAIDTTAHNIANASTVGYSRQQAVLEPTPAYTDASVAGPTQAGQIGTGVDVQSYQRIRDSFIDLQLRAQTMRQGSAQAQADGLSQVEGTLNEPSDTGLSTLFSQFWAAWQDVSNAPENLATRQTLVQTADSLASGLNTLSSQLSTISDQTDQNVTLTLDNVNSIGTQIASLNAAIEETNTTGQSPNDLLDRRDVLVDQLAQLGNVAVSSDGSLGGIDVTIGGATLVSDRAASTLAESDLSSLTSGKLAGLVALRDMTLPGYQDSLDAIASKLITTVNTQHKLGYDLDGNKGVDFFTGTGADDIAVNSSIMASPRTIAASSASGDGGDSANALAIADLQQTAVDGSTIDSDYSTLVTTIGSDSQRAQNDVDTTTALVNSLTDRRQSVSGVSLDEEMTNLVGFQRAYTAAARVMTAMDDMLDTLISKTGSVGL